MMTMQKKIKKCLKHEHLHLKPVDTNVDTSVCLSNITLDYRHVKKGNNPCKLKLTVKGSNVRVLVPKEWYVKIKGKMSLSLLDNYTETYKQETPHLAMEIQSTGGKILIINEIYS